MAWLETWVDDEYSTLFLGSFDTFTEILQKYITSEQVPPNRSREKAAVHHILEEHYTKRPLLKTPEGKPYFEDFKPHVNYSHSKEFFFWGQNPLFPIGVDTETFRTSIHNIAPKFCNESELEWAKKGTELQILTLIWSAKEAMFKAYGKGAIDFKEQLHVVPQPLEDQGHVHAFLTLDLPIRFTVNYRFLTEGICTWTLNKDLQQKGN